LLTTILITGSLSAIPYAYSSGPDTLKVKYTGPIGTDGFTTIEIYKKIDDFGNTPLDVIIITENEEEFMVVALNFAKDKLNSNTVFRILVDGIETAVYEIHTSCSKPLFIGQMVSGQNGVTLEVIDGTLNSESILPDNENEECIDNKKSEQTATIILKKAITNDNGVMIPANLTETFIPKIDGEDILFGEPIPITAKEPHTISEAVVPGYSFVIIAGDTDCPSMLDEVFTVKKNKEITCTIYNDDKFVPGGAGGAGVVFRPTHVTFNPGAVSTFDIPEAEGGGVVTIDVMNADTIIVIDPEFQKTTAQSLIVIYTIIDTGQSGNPIECFPEGLVDTGSSIGFRITCFSELAGDEYALNYALINTIDIT
jgi:hypothetical protein